MNASSLYVTVLRLVFQNDAPNVYRLFPYLRQLLSCSVCGNLLREPFSPLNSPCQHHECRNCVGGRKILKPSCAWCRDRQESVQNVQLRLLLQCYKSLCEYIKLTPIYDGMQNQVQINTTLSGNSSSAQADDPVNSRQLASLIDEGISFTDEYKCTTGLTKEIYSMLPCLYQPLVTAPPPIASPSPPPPVVVVATAPQQPQGIAPSVSSSLITAQRTYSPVSTAVVVQQSPLSTSGGSHKGLTFVTTSGSLLLPQNTFVNAQQQKQNQSLLNQNQQLHTTTGNYNNFSSKNSSNNIATNNSSGGVHKLTAVSTTTTTTNKPPMPIIKTVSNGSALYSVMYAGSGNKITIKRKTDTQASAQAAAHANHNLQQQQLQLQMNGNASGSGDQQQQNVRGLKSNNESGIYGNISSQSGSMATSGTGNFQNHNDSSGSGGGVSLSFKKPPMMMVNCNNITSASGSTPATTTATAATTNPNSQLFNNTSNATATTAAKSKALAKRKGCRCGNATQTPGKLTCCGQRCPCYVESKSCIDCKCRGCRNPHRPNGFKVRPHIPELENIDFHLNAAEQQQQQQNQQQAPMVTTVLRLNASQGSSSSSSPSLMSTMDLDTSSGAFVETDSGFVFSGGGGGGSNLGIGTMGASTAGGGGIISTTIEDRLKGLETTNLNNVNNTFHSVVNGGGGGGVVSSNNMTGTVSQGKIPVLNVYAAPSSSLGQISSTLPTIIMGSHGSGGGGQRGGTSTSRALSNSQQIAATTSTTTAMTTYRFDHGSFVTSNGTLLSVAPVSATGMGHHQNQHHQHLRQSAQSATTMDGQTVSFAPFQFVDKLDNDDLSPGEELMHHGATSSMESSAGEELDM